MQPLSDIYGNHNIFSNFASSISIPRSAISPMNNKLAIKLMPEQEEHVNMLKMMLTVGFPIVIDSSPPGSGKSITAMHIAHTTKLPYIIFGPKAVIHGWTKKVNEYYTDGRLLDMKGYQSMIIKSYDNDKRTVITKDLDYVIGTIVSTPSEHKELYGNMNVKVDGIKYTKDVTYTVTPKLKELVRNGVIIVMDESHSFKNADSSTAQSMIAITQYIVRSVYENPQCQSRVIMMSATPLDAMKQTVTFIRLFDISMDANCITNSSNRLLNMEGYAMDMVKYASRFTNRQDTLIELLGKYNINVNDNWVLAAEYQPNLNSKLKDLCFDILVDVIFPTMSHSIPASDRNVYRGFFKLDFDGTNTNSSNYKHFVSDLSEQIAKLQLTDSTNKKLITKVINQSLQGMEEACVDAICKFLHIRLLTDPHRKVVAAFSFKNSVIKFLSYFQKAGFEAMEFTGNVHPKQRIENRKIFQGGSYTDGKSTKYYDPDVCRVICITSSAGGTGLDFHDEKLKGVIRGRVMAMTPSYKSTELKQTTGRVQRKYVVTDINGNPELNNNGDYIFNDAVSEVYLFFGIGMEGATATGLLSKLYEKAEITRRSIIDLGTDSVRLFPGEYPRYIQGVGYVNEDRYAMSRADGGSVAINTTDLIQMMQSNRNIETLDGPISINEQELINELFNGKSTMDQLIHRLPPVKYGLARDPNAYKKYDIEDDEKSKMLFKYDNKPAGKLRSPKITIPSPTTNQQQNTLWSSYTANQQPSNNNIFGNVQSNEPGLFGNNTNQGGLFGNITQNATQNTNQGGLFGKF